jgi:hypothetical protein
LCQESPGSENIAPAISSKRRTVPGIAPGIRTVSPGISLWKKHFARNLAAESTFRQESRRGKDILPEIRLKKGHSVKSRAAE